MTTIRIERVRKIVDLLNRISRTKAMESMESSETELASLLRDSNILGKEMSIQDLLYSPEGKSHRMQLRAIIREKGFKMPAILVAKDAKVRATAIVQPASSSRPADPGTMRDSPNAYFKRIPDGLVMNLQAIKNKIKHHGLNVTKQSESIDAENRLYLLKLWIAPRDLEKVKHIETWIERSEIEDGTYEIAVHHSSKGSLLFMIEGGIEYLHDFKREID
jgi:hypothetical protein